MSRNVWTVSHQWESPLDLPPPAPGVEVRDTDGLLAVLWQKALGLPFCYNLESSDGNSFTICLGGPWGAIFGSWPTPRGRSHRAARYGGVPAADKVHFQNGREGFPAGSEDLIPAAEVIDAAVLYYERRELSPRLRWVGWDD